MRTSESLKALFNPNHVCVFSFRFLSLYPVDLQANDLAGVEHAHIDIQQSLKEFLRSFKLTLKSHRGLIRQLALSCGLHTDHLPKVLTTTWRRRKRSEGEPTSQHKLPYVSSSESTDSLVLRKLRLRLEEKLIRFTALLSRLCPLNS